MAGSILRFGHILFASVLLIFTVALCWVAFGAKQDSDSAATDASDSANSGAESRPSELRVMFVPEVATFDEVKDNFKHCFHFENRRISPITIRDVTTSCACTVVKPTGKVYGPGEGGEIPVEISLANKSPGAKRYFIRLEYEDGEGSREQAQVSFVLNHKPDILVSPNPVVQRVTVGEEKMVEVTVTDYHTSPVAFNEPSWASKWMKATVLERPSVYFPGWRWKIALHLASANLATGEYKDELVMKAENAKSPEIRVPVLMTIIPRIRVAPTPLYLKRGMDSDQFTGQIFLWDALGGKIELESVDVDSSLLTASVSEVSGKLLVTVAGKADKLARRGDATFVLRINKPCSQVVSVQVRW